MPDKVSGTTKVMTVKTEAGIGQCPGPAAYFQGTYLQPLSVDVSPVDTVHFIIILYRDDVLQVELVELLVHTREHVHMVDAGAGGVQHELRQHYTHSGKEEAQRS